MRYACALHARCMRASCAGHSFSAPTTRCALVDFFKTCALYALCMRTAYVQYASNTLCMRCQLASFFQILTKVRRTTTHWPYFSFFYARTVRRVGVTGPLAKLRHYGVRGVANDWPSSYFENRLQYNNVCYLSES